MAGRHQQDLDVEIDADVARVHVRGDLDIQKAPRLISIVRDVTSRPVQRIDVDCRDVEFLDSAGVRALIVSRNEAQRGDIDLTLVDPSPVVERMVDLTGLAQLLPLHRAN